MAELKRLVWFDALIAGFLALMQPVFALERQLTPEQEAIFPADDPLDGAIWQEYSRPRRLEAAGHPGKRVFKQCFEGYLTPACRALTANQRLHGGVRVGGCYTPEPDPRSPYARKFGAIEWKDVDPLQYLPLIRDIFVSRQQRAAGMFQSTTIPNYYWWRMAPVIKRLLAQNQVLLRRAPIDVDNDGKQETVYALILLPSASCLLESGARSFEASFLYIEEDVAIKASFNEAALGPTVFLYDRRTYFFNGENLGEGLSISAGEDADAARRFFIGPNCRFEDMPLRQRGR
jgi:hypothetical protein